MSEYKHDGKHLDYVPGSDVAVGAIVQTAGLAGIVDPTNDGQVLAAGTLGSVTARGVVHVPNSGITFTDGATVGYDVATDTAVGAGLGDFDIGTANGAFGASDPEVRVVLNAQ